MKAFCLFILKKHKKHTLILFVLGLLSSITSILMNISLKYTVDCIFKLENTYFTVALLLLTVMAIATFISDQIGENYVASKYRHLFEMDLRTKLINKHLSIPYKESMKTQIGELMNQDSEVENIGELFLLMTYFLPYSAFECIFFILYLSFFVSWKMNFVLVILIPFSLILKSVSEKMRQRKGEVVERNARSHQLFLDVVTKLDFVKANNLGETLQPLYQKKNDDLLDSQKQIFRQNAFLSILQFVVDKGVAFVVPIVGAVMLSNGDLTPGDVAVATLIFSSFLTPSLFQIISIYKELKASQDLLENLMCELSKAYCECSDEHTTVKKLNPSVLAQLKDVYFNFCSKNVLQGLSMNLPTFGSIGIYGASGSGKSTLGKILVNLLHPTHGSIVFNSLYFDERNLYSQIAYVGTTPFFIDSSIKDNIRVGGAQWVNACKVSIVDDFLRELPQGEETVIYDNAFNLSGGQKQILAIARMVAKPKVKLVVMDEPTSSLDEASKAQFLDLVKELAKDRCVLIFTHQQDVLNAMDIRMELKCGMLIQQS